MKLELILFDFCPFAQRAVISLKHGKVPHKLTYLDLNDLPDWFHEVSPFGKVPILRVDGKTPIFESAVINELISSVSKKELLPTDLIERALCRSWIEFGSTMLGQLTGMISAGDEKAFFTSHESFLANLQLLEEQMVERGEFFSGDAFTIVDSTFAPLFMRMEYLNKRINLFNPYNFPNIKNWSDNLLQLDSVIGSVPEDFDQIYYKFTEKRGSEGYLWNKKNLSDY